MWGVLFKRFVDKGRWSPINPRFHPLKVRPHEDSDPFDRMLCEDVHVETRTEIRALAASWLAEATTTSTMQMDVWRFILASPWSSSAIKSLSLDTLDRILVQLRTCFVGL